MEITLSRLKVISETRGFNIILIEKDYLLTYLLYLIKDVEGLYFKGGTALNKIVLNHARLSEDLDFTVTKDIHLVENDIKEKLKNTMFNDIAYDKRVDGFVRLVVHYKLFHDSGEIFIDLNKRAKLLANPEINTINHFYQGFIPEFSVNTLNKQEMIAEKMAATIGRNKPRDHYDLYKIIQAEMKINLDLVKNKCKDSKVEFDIIKMFSNAKKLKSRWDEDLVPLLAEEITFEEVMKTLAKYFKLKEEKDLKKVHTTG